MARARNIKPSLFKNEILGVEDPMLTILFISLWCLADKAGRLEDRPLRIKAETFPYRNIETPVFNGYLTDLYRLGFIHRYEVDGIKVIQIVCFEKHQHPHHSERESELPEMPLKSDGCTIPVKQRLNNRPNPSDSLNTDSLNTDSLSHCARERKSLKILEKTEKKPVEKPIEKPVLQKKTVSRKDKIAKEFTMFIDFYPKKSGIDKAFEAWKNRSPDINQVLKTLEWQKKQPSWQIDNENGRFIPSPTTYINNGMYKDQPVDEGEPF